MRKDKLLEFNHELFQELENVKVIAEGLRKENALLRQTITELENENKILKNASFDNKYAEALEQSDSNEALTEEKKPFYKEKREIKLPPMTDYAASIIGKTIVSAAKKCNYLSELQDNPDTKDLINLILGRTEVLKAEILRIVSNEEEISVIKELIDNEHVSAEDYFVSVMAQL